MKLKASPMKNFTCLILLFLSVSFLNKLSAQYDYTYYWSFKVKNLIETANRYGDSTISDVRLHSTYKKKAWTSIYKYNEKGYLTEFYRGKSNDSIEKKAIVTYDSKNLIQHAKFYHKHKIDSRYEFTFNESNKLTSFKKMKGINKLHVLRTNKYNPDGYIEETSETFKKNDEPKFLWKYEYYDKGKLAHAYHFKKGKLKREWDYMCKEEGAEVTRKNFNKVCKWHETDKDTLTAIYQNTDENGKIRKTIYKYTIKDTLILAEIHYNDKNQLQLKITYDKSQDKQLSYTYYKKGNPIYSNQTTYFEDKIISEMHFRKDKMKSKTEYTYIESNRLTSTKSYDKNGKIIGEMTIVYTKR